MRGCVSAVCAASGCEGRRARRRRHPCLSPSPRVCVTLSLVSPCYTSAPPQGALSSNVRYVTDTRFVINPQHERNKTHPSLLEVSTSATRGQTLMVFARSYWLRADELERGLGALVCPGATRGQTCQAMRRAAGGTTPSSVRIVSTRIRKFIFCVVMANVNAPALPTCCEALAGPGPAPCPPSDVDTVLARTVDGRGRRWARHATAERGT